MTTPSWVTKVSDKKNSKEESNTGKNLGEVSHGTLKQKSGRKKSKVARKQMMVVTSPSYAETIEKLETLLKVNGVSINRGRSETIELAVSLLTVLLNTSEGSEKAKILSIIQDYSGKEEREHESIGKL